MINFILKLTFVPLIAVILLTISSVSFAQSWKNSPYNWKNSPSNWQNSPNNYNANNGVYDNRGNRTGYTVQRKDGSGVNIFDNQGNRTGYFNK
jgi:hypothetical protein